MTSPDYFSHPADDECAETPFHYRRSGLDNIYLLNGFEAVWEDGERYVTVLDVDGLHKAIGFHLVCSRKVLTPKEIRFLRKTLDLTQSELGRLIGQSDQQIARWEKGENNISGPADRLLRILFVYELHQSEGKPMPKEFLERLDGLDSCPETKVEFAKEGEDWLEKA